MCRHYSTIPRLNPLLIAWNDSKVDKIYMREISIFFESSSLTILRTTFKECISLGNKNRNKTKNNNHGSQLHKPIAFKRRRKRKTGSDSILMVLQNWPCYALRPFAYKRDITSRAIGREPVWPSGKALGW